MSGRTASSDSFYLFGCFLGFKELSLELLFEILFEILLEVLFGFLLAGFKESL